MKKLKKDDWKKMRKTVKKISKHEWKNMKAKVEKGYCADDVADIGEWFLELMPRMLGDFKKYNNGVPGKYGDAHPDWTPEEQESGWLALLDKMIFLFREARMETCSQTNPYEEEMDAAVQNFSKEHDVFEGGVFHSISEVPEYQEIHRKWTEREKELESYREECREKALALFAEWLPSLWL